MKIFKITVVIMALFAIGIIITSCGSKSNNSTKMEQAEKQGKEYDSAYVCPMHCESSGSDSPGNCPVCGMTYEKNENHKADGHRH